MEPRLILKLRILHDYFRKFGRISFIELLSELIKIHFFDVDWFQKFKKHRNIYRVHLRVRRRYSHRVDSLSVVPRIHSAKDMASPNTSNLELRKEWLVLEWFEVITHWLLLINLLAKVVVDIHLKLGTNIDWFVWDHFDVLASLHRSGLHMLPIRCVYLHNAWIRIEKHIVEVTLRDLKLSLLNNEHLWQVLPLFHDPNALLMELHDLD